MLRKYDDYTLSYFLYIVQFQHLKCDEGNKTLKVCYTNTYTSTVLYENFDYMLII